MSETITGTLGASSPRWPHVVGTIGIVVAVIAFIDRLDDLLFTAWWSEETWRSILGVQVGEFVIRALPSQAWLVTQSLIGMALAVVLFTASRRLRGRRRSGVTLCRVWAWLVIAWVAIDISQAVRWMMKHAGEISDLAAGAEWQGYAIFGVVLALAMLLAFPIFLLVWLARPDTQTEWTTWPE